MRETLHIRDPITLAVVLVRATAFSFDDPIGL